MRASFLSILIACVISFTLVGQATIVLNSEKAMPSYTLFSDGDFRGESVYLVDNCGNFINTWENVPRAQHHYKLLPTGNIIGISNGTDIIEIDWDGNTVVDISIIESNLYLDYEVIVMPNGNYLCLGRREQSSAYFDSIGYDPNLGSPTNCDVVVEVNPEGDIVWEWNICEHVIQERNPFAANYGILANNPQLLNMDAVSLFDWDRRESFMINGMDYNPELDQIALSVRKISEVAIIDHSTTAAEAKGNSGGNHGKGGDIIYRWGNPQNYNRGDRDDRILYFQHNPNWIKYGADKGKIIVYNNGLNKPVSSFNDRFSSIEIFDPEIDGMGNYVLNSGMAYQPIVSDKAYNKSTIDLIFYSGYESGTQVLPNGNILITVYGDDMIIEITPEGETVWRLAAANLFRSEKYPLDFPAFEGKDLTIKLENSNPSYNCRLTFDGDLDGDNFTVEQGDCDDFNALVFPGNIETPYNGLDDDCNMDTPDDDLDGDGYILILDCDDYNPEINFGMDEIPYNGIDDDCSHLTPDDDIDGDGFLVAEDCDDENDEINPLAIEIPHNGIDENCDGLDSTTATEAEIGFSEDIVLWPNPAHATIFVSNSNPHANFDITIRTVNGEQLGHEKNTRQLDLSAYAAGLYFLEVVETNTSRVSIQKLVIVR